MKALYKILFIIFGVTVSLSACSKDQPDDPKYLPTTKVGTTLVNDCKEVARVFKDTSFVVALGVEETDLHLQTMSGYVQQIYVLRIDTNVPGVRVKVSMPYNSNNISGGWLKQTLTEMASIMDKPRARVAGMVNGDFWNTTAPINPRGPVHRGGTIVSSEWDYSPSVPQQALSFIAINSDGKMVIRDKSEYEEMKSELRECTGAGLMLLSNGHFSGTEWSARDPRTAIGYTSDGIIYFLTADGRKTFGAAGLTYEEMAYMFQSLGCEGAANLDGGGSAQFLVRHPVGQVFQIRNSPADGAERPVVSGWAVIVDEP
ncbi:MAG: phosphodiester glycosidase family protein [Bacteroidales bacterium]